MTGQNNLKRPNELGTGGGRWENLAKKQRFF